MRRCRLCERLIGDERGDGDRVRASALPYVRMWRGKMLVNVASAGLPKDGDARAGYAIFTERSGGWQVKHRRVPFDVKKVATQLADCGIPGSAELIATLRRHRYKRLKGFDSIAAPAIEIEHLVKRYGDFHRRRRHFAARRRRASSSASSGPNGAGKTTTINAIVGLAQDTAVRFASSATTTERSGAKRAG